MDEVNIGDIIVEDEEIIEDIVEEDEEDIGPIEEDIVAEEGIKEHNRLRNLDYEHSGHTGFQAEIEDLEEIRSGAEAGSTAVQDDGYIHTDNNFTDEYKKKIEDLKEKPYVSLERLASYLYKVSFDNIPEEKEMDSLIGGCSSYVKDGKLYRNLDWNYDENNSFLVQCKGFKGMAFLNGLDDENMDNELIGQLPYHLVDGVNENGIMVSTHVLFNDWDWHGAGEKNISLNKLPYIILSTIKSLDNITNDLTDILSNIATTAALDRAEYLLQFIVTDGSTTYAILPPTSSTGAYVIENITSNPKLTNFRWVNSETVERVNLQRRPTGVERWNLIPTALENLRFTKAYEEPTRLSEFIGINETTKDSTDEELTLIYNRAREIYEDRERDGETWQTMHSIVYSSNGIEELYVQENWNINYAKEKIPIKTSELINDSNFVEDENYVHTDNNYTDEEKEKLDGLENYDDTEIRQDLANKVDKVSGKGLSTNDYTTAEKNKLANLNNYDDTEVKADITAIESKIPDQATAQNKLADKDFVNSSIATNTAYFKGTYESTSELPTTGVTNNDYAFIVIYDTEEPTQVKQYDRYKYNGSAWVYEYTLNNSSFTAQQWASIQSGITSGLVEKLQGIETGAEVNVLEGIKVQGVEQTISNKEVDLDVATTEQLEELINWQEATGKEISIDNALDYKLKLLELSGDSKQDSTTGANILNPEWWNLNNVIIYSQNGKQSIITTKSGNERVSKSIDILSLLQNNIGKKIKWTYKSKDVSNYTSDNPIVAQLAYKINSSGINYSCRLYANDTTDSDFVIPNGLTSALLYLYGNNSSTVLESDNIIIFDELMLQLYNTNPQTNYEPYTGGIQSPNPEYKQDIRNVKSSNGVIEWKKTGKNLFDKNNTTTQVGYFTNTGNIQTGGQSTITTSFTKITPNIDMILSGFSLECVCYYDENYNFIERVTGASSKNINKNAHYIRFQGATNNFDLNIIQLEQGSTATSYEPYKSVSVPFNIGTEEFCKLPNNVADKLWVNMKTGEYGKTVYVGKVVLDGSENWGNAKNVTDNNIHFSTNCIDNLNIPEIGLSDRFSYSRLNIWNNDVIGLNIKSNAYNLRVRIPKELLSDISTVQNAKTSFKTWLSTHNTIVYYELATPVTTTLGTLSQENLAKLKTYAGTNNITITGCDDITPYIDMIYPTKVSGGTGDFEQLTNRPKYNGNTMNKNTNIPAVPTKTSDLTNDSGFITNTVNNLINYYLKSETYTKTEVNNLIGQIQTAHFEVVQQLPQTGESNIIYLIPKQGETGDIYNEYIWVNNTWELIGSTQVDLTGYATEIWVNQRISNFLTQAQIESLINTTLSNYYNKNTIDNLLDDKQDKLTSLQEIEDENDVIWVENLENGGYICKRDCTLINNDNGQLPVEKGAIFVKNDAAIGLMYGYGLCYCPFGTDDWNDVYAPTFEDMYNATDEVDVKNISGFSYTKNQILKNNHGTLRWVDE